MIEFEKFTERHGEIVAQAILENLERHEGVRSCVSLSLADRWQVLMQDHTEQRLAA